MIARNAGVFTLPLALEASVLLYSRSNHYDPNLSKKNLNSQAIMECRSERAFPNYQVVSENSVLSRLLLQLVVSKLRKSPASMPVQEVKFPECLSASGKFVKLDLVERETSTHWHWTEQNVTQLAFI